MTMISLRRLRRARPGRASLHAAALLLAGATLLPPGAGAIADDLLVIVNADSAVTRMSAREVRKLFLGKGRRLPDGSRAVLARFEPADTRFNERALGRSDAQVSAAWSRLKFSGRVRAPHTFDSAAELARFVATTPNAIAYLSIAELPAGVRSVFAVPD